MGVPVLLLPTAWLVAAWQAAYSDGYAAGQSYGGASPPSAAPVPPNYATDAQGSGITPGVACGRALAYIAGFEDGYATPAAPIVVPTPTSDQLDVYELPTSTLAGSALFGVMTATTYANAVAAGRAYALAASGDPVPPDYALVVLAAGWALSAGDVLTVAWVSGWAWGFANPVGAPPAFVAPWDSVGGPPPVQLVPAPDSSSSPTSADMARVVWNPVQPTGNGIVNTWAEAVAAAPGPGEGSFRIEIAAGFTAELDANFVQPAVGDTVVATLNDGVPQALEGKLVALGDNTTRQVYVATNCDPGSNDVTLELVETVGRVATGANVLAGSKFVATVIPEGAWQVVTPNLTVASGEDGGVELVIADGAQIAGVAELEGSLVVRAGNTDGAKPVFTAPVEASGLVLPPVRIYGCQILQYGASPVFKLSTAECNSLGLSRSVIAIAATATWEVVELTDAGNILDLYDESVARADTIRGVVNTIVRFDDTTSISVTQTNFADVPRPVSSVLRAGVIKGTATLVGGVSGALSAPGLALSSAILVTPRTPNNGGVAPTTTVMYAALEADKNYGAGTFKISALDATLAPQANDVSDVDWTVIL